MGGEGSSASSLGRGERVILCIVWRVVAVGVDGFGRPNRVL